MITIEFTLVVSSSAGKTRRRGVVTWFNPNKGYGFIKDDKGKPLMVHYNNIKMDGYRKLTKGQEVTYEVGNYQKYQQAFEVRTDAK